MVEVLSVSMGADPAGASYALTETLRGTDVSVRSTVRKSNYLDYPTDLPWAEAGSAWQTADVVHLHQSLKPLTMFGPRPFVLHHHGTIYRRNPDLFNQAVADAGGTAVVSTLDLLDYSDELTWIPHPVNIGTLAGYRAPQQGRLRVGHAPTARTIKDTDAFLAACERLNVEPVLIERTRWADCLRIKGTVDVLYDQVQLGYGVNSVEAWAMGIPVIAGAQPATLDRMRATFGTLPFYEATADTILDAIEALTDETTRALWADTGQAHAVRWHDGAETRARLTAIYQAADTSGNL